MDKQFNVRIPVSTSEQIDWLIEKTGMTKTQLLVVMADRFYQTVREEELEEMRFTLAQEANPYSPDSWLGEPQVLELLQKAGYNFTRLYAKFVREELQTGGPDQGLYISKLSVEQYIKRRQHEENEMFG